MRRTADALQRPAAVLTWQMVGGMGIPCVFLGSLLCLGSAPRRFPILYRDLALRQCASRGALGALLQGRKRPVCSGRLATAASRAVRESVHKTDDRKVSS